MRLIHLEIELIQAEYAARTWYSDAYSQSLGLVEETLEFSGSGKWSTQQQSPAETVRATLVRRNHVGSINMTCLYH